MPAKIVVPELGESVVEATVGRWLKKEGERVTVGEPLVALETDKIDLEVGAERGGVLARIERKEGEDVHIGDVLGLIEEAAAASPGAEPAPPAAPKAAAVPAAAGSSRRANGDAKPPHPPAPAPVASGGAPTPPATPLARRVAEAHGIDLAQVSPGKQGSRIRQRDVEKFLEKQGKPATPRAAASSVPAPLEKPAQRSAVAEDRAALEERVRMSRRRQTIARRLVEAQHTAAMLTTFNEVDMSAVVELRRRHKEEFKQKHGVGLGITSFFVKAAVSALGAFPRLNAEIQGEEMVLKHYYDIGVAVGAADGLVVPVLRDADRMSFAEIERGIKEFSRRAGEGSLTLDDLSGGTFTVTNGGIFGSLLSTPILNPPQSAILGLHKIEDRAVPRQGQVVIRPMMYVALSYDHRIVDGLEAVQFLVRVKELVEEPGSLLLEI
jgi:2-oxoglutarate dehydrogenase E2 component (dihydrolipoamide succinyltransferase)